MKFELTKNKPFTSETPVGTETNHGKLVNFDERGTAHFITSKGHKGWVGNQAFFLVQVLPK